MVFKKNLRLWFVFIWKKEKCSSLGQPRSKFCKTQWARQGVKLSRLISIFTSKNVWKFLIKIQLTKSNLKIIRGVNPPCLMPIRVKKVWNYCPGPPTCIPFKQNYSLAQIYLFLFEDETKMKIPFEI